MLSMSLPTCQGCRNSGQAAQVVTDSVSRTLAAVNYSDGSGRMLRELFSLTGHSESTIMLEDNLPCVLAVAIHKGSQAAIASSAINGTLFKWQVEAGTALDHCRLELLLRLETEPPLLAAGAVSRQRLLAIEQTRGRPMFHSLQGQ